MIEKTYLGSDVTLNKSSNFSLTFNVVKTGYTPMAVCSWSLANRDSAQYIHISGIEIGINSGNVYIQGRYSNSSVTSKISSSEAYVVVLYEKQ